MQHAWQFSHLDVKQPSLAAAMSNRHEDRSDGAVQLKIRSAERPPQKFTSPHATSLPSAPSPEPGRRTLD